ncbi:hypothetical protein SAMN02745163_01793 [Clostridium cavendishii DSM 21758]|uniref:Uncharacterized protein n=1 Tax=Clostridium cavendishii DSM 21758 TaxID=1121302 RepID=A0A1M6IRC1_9CLOT|nr:hypothetical protein [Clostridium cavendishii]SHJ36945.1 hypothetical protein SAMN02745163_01793 [Clostridium cavendishii DSM 21758]
MNISTKERIVKYIIIFFVFFTMGALFKSLHFTIIKILLMGLGSLLVDIIIDKIKIYRKNK